jgi:hypothetical protein
MAHRYTSPYRPLDIGYAAKIGEVEIDWSHIVIGEEWTAATVYAFTEPLPDDVIDSLQLTSIN